MDFSSPRVQGAVIGAAVVVLTLVVREFIQWLRERAKLQKETTDAYQKYADPLLSSAVALLWRLNEIFIKRGRGAFLRKDAPANSFTEYKRASTLYRFAALLGWIRAMRRELSFLKAPGKNRSASIDKAMGALEESIADGPHIEDRRLEEFCRLWGLGTSKDKEKNDVLAVEIEYLINKHLERLGGKDEIGKADGFCALAVEDRLPVCEGVAKLVCEKLGYRPVDARIVRETVEQASRVVGIREAWVYRDWQAAIGDLMLEEVSGQSRRFDVKGYLAFEAMWTDEEAEARSWLERLNRLFHGLDLSVQDKWDARPAQLANILTALAKLVLALGEMDAAEGLLSEKTKSKAEKLAKMEQKALVACASG